MSLFSRTLLSVGIKMKTKRKLFLTNVVIYQDAFDKCCLSKSKFVRNVVTQSIPHGTLGFPFVFWNYETWMSWSNIDSDC